MTLILPDDGKCILLDGAECSENVCKYGFITDLVLKQQINRYLD